MPTVLLFEIKFNAIAFSLIGGMYTNMSLEPPQPIGKPLIACQQGLCRGQHAYLQHTCKVHTKDYTIMFWDHQHAVCFITHGLLFYCDLYSLIWQPCLYFLIYISLTDVCQVIFQIQSLSDYTNNPRSYIFLTII